MSIISKAVEVNVEPTEDFSWEKNLDKKSSEDGALRDTASNDAEQKDLSCTNWVESES